MIGWQRNGGCGRRPGGLKTCGEKPQAPDAFAARLNVLAPLAWNHEGILIRPCAAPEELDTEGKTLHHCVATYKEKHAGGNAAIFFIRRATEPDKPLVYLGLKAG